jgi:ferredoxin
MPEALPRPHHPRARSRDRQVPLHRLQVLREGLSQRLHRRRRHQARGEKKKSVTEFKLDFTKCSLCGSCVEVCPTDALEFSKDYNLASTSKEAFYQIDLLKTTWRNRDRNEPGSPPPIPGRRPSRSLPSLPPSAGALIAVLSTRIIRSVCGWPSAASGWPASTISCTARSSP